MLEPSSGDARCRERSLSWLVRILCFALVPILVLGATDAANAANAYGPATPVEFDYDLGTFGGGGSCNLSGYWENNGSAPGIYLGGNCSAGLNGGFSSLDFIIEGSDVDGHACEVVMGTDVSGFGNFGGNATVPDLYGSISTDGTASTCRMSEVCWELDKSQLGDDKAASGCVVADFGAISKANGVCPFGEPTKIENLINNKPPGGWYEWMAKIHTNQKSGNQWAIGIVVRFTNGEIYAGDPSFEGTPIAYNPTMGASVNSLTSGGYNSTSYPRGYTADLIGVQVVTRNVSGQPYDTWRDFTALPQEKVGGDLGVTNAAACTWYFGPKIADPASIVDPLGNATAVPVAGVGQPAPTPPATTPPTTVPPTAADEPNECTFSISDPSSWLNAGMCAAVGFLKAIWKAINALAGAVKGIASAILDGIGGLFIPDAGFFDAKFGELDGAFDDTAPGQYVEAVETLTPAGAATGGCAGPSYELDVFDVHKTIQPLNACGGAAGNAAALVKLLLTVGLSVFGAIACLRGIGSGLGWNVSLGRGGDSA